MTNIRTAFVSGTGTFVDAYSSVTVANTRVRAINIAPASQNGRGQVVITGTTTTPFGETVGNRIKLAVNDRLYFSLPDNGVRFPGKIIVSAAASIATTIYYG